MVDPGEEMPGTNPPINVPAGESGMDERLAAPTSDAADETETPEPGPERLSLDGTGTEPTTESGEGAERADPESVAAPVAAALDESPSPESGAEHEAEDAEPSTVAPISGEEVPRPEVGVPASPAQAEHLSGSRLEADVTTIEIAPRPQRAEKSSEPEAADGRPEAGAELEELTLPSSIEVLAPLPAGSAVGPEERVRIVELRATRGRVNVYSAQWKDGEELEQPVDLIEGPIDAAGLQREAELLSQIRYAMLPTLHASWVTDDRRYLVLDRTEGATLEEAFQTGMSTEATVSVVLQITQALRRLQAAGWAAVGLSPSAVVMGDPIRLVALDTAVRIGEESHSTLHVAGYSAPETALPTVVTGKEDVYTLGALLFRGLAGAPLGEEGPQLADLSSAVHVPGVPQLLALVLAPAEARVDLDEFYHRLLQLKRRLTSSPLALRIAVGTTIGLNPTRVTNEDACGHTSWSSEYEGISGFNAVLCVVDGMGGMEAGEVASTAAVRAVLSGAARHAADAITSAPGSDREADSAGSRSLDPMDLVQAAAEAVHGSAAGRQVGATITCVAIEDSTLQLAHVGDTRAYLVRQGEMTQLTRDHSLVAAMVSSGVITPEEARGHPESNKVLRSLGSHRSLPDNYIDGLEPAYGQSSLRLQPDDLVILCSDGVWGQVEDDKLLRLCDSPDPENAVQAVLQAALDSGAPDNASVVIARCYALRAW